MRVDRHPAFGMIDISRGQIEHIDIGHAARAIDDTIGLGGMLVAVMGEDHPQPVFHGIDALHAHLGHDTNPDAFAFRLEASDRVGVHRGQ